MNHVHECHQITPGKIGWSCRVCGALSDAMGNVSEPRYPVTSLCENCMVVTTVDSVTVIDRKNMAIGHYDLCGECERYLIGGDIDQFHARHTSVMEVTVSASGDGSDG